uniref:Uncharacterized protein n=1 Tax=Stegastes partitus TaxID=144197 RepID=A0A3B5AQX8_9TELE
MKTFSLQIHELGNPKGKKTDDTPMFYEVTEPAKVLLDAGEEIPCDLMAKILKFQLLQIKANDQQRREAELLQLGSRIFGGVANLIYECLDWRRQHKHYQDNVKVIDVPTVIGLDSQPVKVHAGTKLPPLSIDVDMCYYSNLLDLVPPEACSVPLILDCMLEQVRVNSVSSLFVSAVCGIGYMLQSFLPLVHTEEERSHMLNSLVATVVEGFDPAEVELSMMKKTPVWELIQSVAQQRQSSSCWMSVRQQLQHYCADDIVSWSEVERLFHQSVFETMPLTTLDQQGVLANDARLLGTLEPAQQQTSIIPWDNPLSYAKQQFHNLQNKADSSAKTRTESPPVDDNEELHHTEEPFNVRAHTQKPLLN